VGDEDCVKEGDVEVEAVETQHTEGPTLRVDVSPEIVGSFYVSGVGREGSCDKVRRDLVSSRYAVQGMGSTLKNVQYEVIKR